MRKGRRRIHSEAQKKRERNTVLVRRLIKTILVQVISTTLARESDQDDSSQNEFTYIIDDTKAIA